MLNTQRPEPENNSLPAVLAWLIGITTVGIFVFWLSGGFQSVQKVGPIELSDGRRLYVLPYGEESLLTGYHVGTSTEIVGFWKEIPTDAHSMFVAKDIDFVDGRWLYKVVSKDASDNGPSIMQIAMTNKPGGKCFSVWFPDRENLASSKTWQRQE